MKNTHRRTADGKIVQKPEAIIYYNHKMGGVDNIDQQLHSLQLTSHEEDIQMVSKDLLQNVDDGSY